MQARNCEKLRTEYWGFCLRRDNAKYFGAARKIAFLGREWFAYGNTDILNLPELLPIRGRRPTASGSEEWRHFVSNADLTGASLTQTLQKPCAVP